MPRPYKITSYDDSLADIASRFGIDDANGIVLLNLPPLGGQGIHSSIPWALVGITIQLPDDTGTDAFDWEPYVSPGGETLDAVCTKVKKDPRALNTPVWWVTPDSLLNAYMNADLRAGHGKSASGVTLAQDETLMVPFPSKPGGASAIGATPQGATTFKIPPAWLKELTSSYEWIRANLRLFANRMAALKRQRKAALDEIALLNCMNGVLAITIAHPAKDPLLAGPELSSLRGLRRCLSDMQQAAIDAMYTHFFDNLPPAPMADAVALGKQILAKIQDARFITLTKQLTTSVATYPKACSELCDVISYAYELFVDSPLASDAESDIAAAAAYVAGVRPISVDTIPQKDADFANALKSISAAPIPNSVLGLVLGVFMTGTATVGNMPGPSSLCVAAVRVKAVYAGHKRLMTVTQGGTAGAIDEAAVVAAAAINGLGTTAAETAEIQQFVADVRQGVLNRLSPSALLASVHVDTELIANDNLIRTTKMAGSRWTKGVSIANAIIFAIAIADVAENGWNAATGGEVVSGTLGLIQVAGVVGPALKMMSASVADGLGSFCAGIGVLLSGYEAIVASNEGRMEDAWVDIVSMTGAAFLTASLVVEPFAPIIAFVGGVLVVGATVYGVLTGKMTFQDVLDLGRPAPEVWWLHVLDAFTKGSNYTAIAPKVSDLPAHVDTLRTVITNTNFLLIDASQRDSVAKLIGKDTLDMLAAAPPAP